MNLFALTSALALTTCSDEEVNTLTPDLPIGEKSPIELSVGVKGDLAPLTRTITTKPNDESKYRAFDASTNLYMIYKCEDLSAASRATKYSKTIGLALPVTTPPDGSFSNIDFARDFTYSTADKGKFMRYWDDAYARESALSIYAICFPGCNAYGQDGITDTRGINFGNSSYANIAWGTTAYSTLISWELSDQNVDNAGLAKIDMCYSNNISQYVDSEGNDVDARLKFGTYVPKHFDEGEMVFYHMASKFTFIIKKGDTFAANEAFDFETDKNVILHGFNYRVENFDVATGELNSGNGAYKIGDINLLWEDNDATIKDANNNVLGHTIRGLVFPTTDMTATDDDAKNAVTFTINDNKYVVSRKDLYNAILNKKDAFDNYVYGNGTAVSNEYLENGTKLKAGVHYVFTFTINKSQIKNITASVVDWEDVNAEHDPSNARIKLQLEERTGEHTETLGDGSKFSLYMATDNIADADPIVDDYEVYNWSKTYNTTGIVPAWDSDHWKTDLFWPDNKTFYHFRALCEKTSEGIASVTSITNDDAGDYITLSHKESGYKDILWGAPMRDIGDNSDDNRKTLKWVYGPETNGFDCKDDNNHTVATGLPSGTQHQIYQAIGPTKDAIKLILFHMMSDVTFKIKTTSGAEAVNLGNGDTEKTTIKLEQIHTTGNLYMGNGLVRGNTADVANSNYQFTQTPAPLDGVITWSNYGAIPQSLEDVVLVITTPDHNQYKVAMKDVLATTVNPVNLANPYSKVGGTGTDKDKYKIDRWYPGFKYIYTFTLKKTGITDLQVTILDWETVEADEQVVVIQ